MAENNRPLLGPDGNPVERKTEMVYRPDRFGVRAPSLPYLNRVRSWLEHLGIADCVGLSTVPTPETRAALWELPPRLLSQYGQTGGTRVYGQAFPEEGILVTQSGYAHVLVHELAHIQARPEPIDEATAVATGIFALGSERAILQMIYGNNEVYGRHAQQVAAVHEAVSAGGSDMIHWLQTMEPEECSTFPGLLQALTNRVKEGERRFLDSDMTSQDYLTRLHGLSPHVAGQLLEVTSATRDEIYRDNCGAFRDYTAAFKALASFYHINLGMSLEDAIRATNVHFEKDEAVDLALTLHDGAQEVFSLLKSAKCPADLRWAIVYLTIANGPEFANQAAKEVPAMLDILNYYGRRGGQLLEDLTQNEALLKAFIQSGLFSGLVDLRNPNRSGRGANTRLILPILQALAEFRMDLRIPEITRNVESNSEIDLPDIANLFGIHPTIQRKYRRGPNHSRTGKSFCNSSLSRSHGR